MVKSNRRPADPKPPRLRLQNPETSVITQGYDPELSVMAARSPIYPVSTYCFHSAEEAKSYFDIALGREPGDADHSGGLIYARLNNPNAEIFEDLMVPLEAGAAAAASFASGMAAITAVFLAFLRPGDVVIHTTPVYGGTDHLLHHLMIPFGIRAISVPAGDAEALDRAAREHAPALALLYLETPANPTLRMSDIAAAARTAAAIGERGERRAPLLAVDNTFLGPMFQSALHHGADLSVYSATKYIGGHSDVVAGVVLAKDAALVQALKNHRAFFGTICEPFSAWLLQRSLATIYTRTVKQSKNARRLVERFQGHAKIARIHYPTLFEGDQHRIYAAQCTAPGSMIGFELRGGRAEAFRFLNALRIPKLAVSLGGVESLITHPRTTTSSELSNEELDRAGIAESLVRYSTGVEYWRDLADDLETALAAV